MGGGPVRKERRVPARATREEVLVGRGAVIRKREGTDRCGRWTVDGGRWTVVRVRVKG